MSTFWQQKPVLVTGGGGFLGSFVVERLRARGCEGRRAPSAEYDLVDRAAVRRLIADARPEMVIHLAARVGGIGANRDNPGRFLYENAMMGLQLFEECRLAKVPKLVAPGTICAYPKFAPVPFREDDLWNGYPEETNAPYGIAKKLMLVQSQAYREQYGMNSIVLFPVNLYGPRDNFDLQSSHVIPAMIRKCVDRARTRRQRGGAVGRRLADARVPLRRGRRRGHRAGGRALRLQRSGQPGQRQGDRRSATWRSPSRAPAGFDGRFVWDTSKPNGQPRRQLDVTRARERFGFEARTPFDAGHRGTVAWYEEHQKEIEKR